MKRTGFTLIELIISTTIFTVVIVTVYSVFYMGVKTWRRTQVERPLQKTRLALLKIEKELKEAFFFSEKKFKGTSSEMSFPLTISEKDAERLYTVTYSVNEDEHTGLKEILRKERVFPKTEEGEEKIKEMPPLMKSIRFEYAYKSSSPSKNFEWKDVWNGEEQNKLPSGIRISLERDEDKEIYTKVILLQQGDFDIK